MAENTNPASDLEVVASYSRKPRFKPGTDLAGKPSRLVVVDVQDQTDEDGEFITVSMNVQTRVGDVTP